MKKISWIILFTCSIIFGQQSKKFNEIIETQENETLKCFLDKDFCLIEKKCSKYYMTFQLDNENFQFKDTLKVFYNNGQLYSKQHFINGKKSGLSICYFPNGTIEHKGEYQLDKKNGEWEFYYPNGNLMKKVIYDGDYIFLLEFFNENREKTVENGNGFFLDKKVFSGSTISTKKVLGRIKDGLQDGTWEFYTNGVKIGSEYFENKMFIKGISYSSAIGNSEYYNNFYATFSEDILIDHLSFSFIRHCQLIGMVVSIKNDFNKNLKLNYESSDLKNELTDGWFFVGMEYNESNELINVDIYSPQDINKTSQLKNIITRTQKETSKALETKNIYKFFPIVISQQKMFLPRDKEIELLN